MLIAYGVEESKKGEVVVDDVAELSGNLHVAKCGPNHSVFHLEPTTFPALPNHSAQAKLLEHNVRFGDPECQNLMARLDSDLTDTLQAATSGRLDTLSLQVSGSATLFTTLHPRFFAHWGL